MKNSKEILFPFFAYKTSLELDPDKYGSVSTIEEWSELINSSKEDVDTISKMAAALTEQDWETLDKEYEAASSVELAKKGTKLKKLRKVSKKCTCGCDLVTKMTKGGVVEVCSCGCKAHK